MKGDFVSKAMLALVPWLCGTLGNAAITENSTITLALFLSGLSGTAVIFWWARGRQDDIIKRIVLMEMRMDRVEKKVLRRKSL